VEVLCPYCGEPTELAIEAAGRCVEDCTVCCRPIDVVATMDEDGELEVQANRQDD
jgi:hypothetical protein